jgi:hypothetical protein
MELRIGTAVATVADGILGSNRWNGTRREKGYPQAKIPEPGLSGRM